MAIDFPLPQMGFDMTEARIGRWLKKEGETVAPGEVLAEIATEKVSLELVDHPGGVVEKILVPEGETVPVGTPIVRLGEANGATTATQPTASQPAAADPAAQEVAHELNTSIVSAPSVSSGNGAASASQPAAPSTTVASGARASSPPSASTASPDAPAEDASRTRERVKASPLARKVAEARGIDLGSIQGSGPMGRILRDDVLAAGSAPASASTPAAAAPAPRPEAPTPITSVAAAAPATAGPQDLSPMRQVIARRLQESKQQIPHFYLTVEVRADRILALRPELNAAAAEGSNITVNDFVIKATALALAKNPALNAWFVDNKIRSHDRINIGLAVALEEGLVVPALLDCQSRSLARKISTAAKDLVQRAKKGSVKPEEFTGGTFSISNLGMFGVDNFQAIINPPQVGILAVGAAVKRPVVEGNSLVVGSVMQICLSCDHRVVDGATGARFLADLKRFLENPMLMLL